MNDKLLKLRSVLKTMPLNDNQINNILGIIDTQNKEIDDTIAPLLEEYYSYGIEKDYTNSNPNCIRIGNLYLHKTLPIQSRMRGCLLDDDGNVVEYLPENDWTTATRDGSKGQVMVHIPHHYRRFYTKDNNNIICTRISELPLKGYHYVPDMFVSAYEASIEHSSGKLCSVVNHDIDYRGGNNNAEWDKTYRSLLGKPITTMGLSEFRLAARKRNPNNTSWNCYLYDVHKTLFWLFTIEYATFNSQDDYNSTLTSDGFRQGGLGVGVTGLSSSDWANFNDYNPLVPCGYTDTLGNRTGIVDYTLYNENGSVFKTVSINRYRGIENIFSHIFKCSDGCKCINQSEENGGLSKFYVCDEPANFTNSGVVNYQLRSTLISRKSGFIKTLIFGEYGDIMPIESGNGSSTTYFCDYYYPYIPEHGTNERVVSFGGALNNFTNAGLLCIRTAESYMDAVKYIGSRLCFIPQQNKN